MWDIEGPIKRTIYIQLRVTVEKVGVKQASQKPFPPQAWSNVKLTTSLLPATDHVEFMYLAFTRMQGESYRTRLRSLLLYLYYVFLAIINYLVGLLPTADHVGHSKP